MTVHESDTVTIPLSEYLSLREDVAKLRRLEAAGVDNWDGYCTAESDD